jgi:release factor glutamine methyltransferase
MPPRRTGQPATVSAAIDEGERRIARSKAIDHWEPAMARIDAEDLLAAVLHDEAPLDEEIRISAAQWRRFESHVGRRVLGEPVAFITGRVIFRDLEIRVRPGVFSPRASTELLAEEAIKRLRRKRGDRVSVDLATGNGPVALSVGAEVPRVESWGLDISADAVRLGRSNARRLGLDNVHFRVSDMLDKLPRALAGHVDVFTLHPPYVARRQVATLPREIRDFEPMHSLTDRSNDGLDLVRKLADEAADWLTPRGTVLIEVGPYLSRSARAILRRAGFDDITWTAGELKVTHIIAARRG